MFNKIKYCILAILSLSVIFYGCYVLATDNQITLIYPKKNAKIYANSTFFVGNTKHDSKLMINDEPVNVYPNGSFVKVVNLKSGDNKFILKSIRKNDITIYETVINVSTVKNNTLSKTVEYIDINKPCIVTEDEAPLRVSPYGNRLTPVKKGVVFQALGLINEHYKLKLNDNQYAYINKNHAEEYSGEKLGKQTLDKIAFEETRNELIISIPVNQPVLTEIKTNKNNMSIQLHDTILNFEKIYIPDISNMNINNDTFSFDFSKTNFNGYDYNYNNNKFNLIIRKPFTHCLQGKIVVIDPGHGGKECGSTGPTGVPEKNINLKISKYLKDELEQSGAKVILTRENDEYVDLYERVKIAQEKHADLLISIHNNALPDGANPYIEHGTTTYYYQEQAMPLAKSVQNHLLKATCFKNLGIKSSSFVLTRPTNPISILIEVGFMINPYEYAALLNENNQKRYAQGIKNGIEEYFKL